VLAQPDGVPCFIEDLMVLSRDRRPATSTLRNTRLIAAGGLGEGQVKEWATAYQAAQAADAGVEAPALPSTGHAWVLPLPRGWSPAAVGLRSSAAHLVEGLTGRLVS
jgi:hypothetical protein